jgi:hypothetical protein
LAMLRSKSPCFGSCFSRVHSVEAIISCTVECRAYVSRDSHSKS